MAEANSDATAAACRYVLVALLQRLEKTTPGLLADLQAGIAADQRATPPGQPYVDATFAEALRMLAMAARG